MGTPMAPSAANLFMGRLEEQIFQDSPVKLPVEFWKRYIDDVFLLWTDSEDKLNQFLQFINTVHPTIKFTSSSSQTSLPFLDILITLQGGFLSTSLYSKPTDAHAYLPATSCHPRHVIRNMPQGEFLRLRRLCSDEDSFQDKAKTMERWFTLRGHRPQHVKEAKEKARLLPRRDALCYKTKEKADRTPFLITHHPHNPPLRQWLTELHESVLHTSAHMRQASPTVPVVGERNCRNLRSLLMPTRLPTPDQEAPGCYNCNNRCVICKEHMLQTNTFTSDTTHETFKIKQHVTCTSSNIIYLLFCDQCKQAQYIGETKNTLKTRFYMHRNHIKQNSGTCTLVTHHFNQPNHSVKNMKCIIIEQMDGKSGSVRQTREKKWMDRLRTVTPNGLNIRDK